MIRSILSALLFLSLPTSVWAEGDADDLSKAIVGKWSMVSGSTDFGIFAGESEFTKDGKFLQKEGKDKWLQSGTYKIEKDELILNYAPLGRKKTIEIRCKISSISDTKLISTTPKGELKRIK